VALDAAEQLSDRTDGDALRGGPASRGYMIALVSSYGHEAVPATAVSASSGAAAVLGRNLYLVFVASWFLHLAERIPALGIIRFDLLLCVVLAGLAVASRSPDRTLATETDKFLRTLFLYVLVTLPFVEWPGSVIRSGIPEFVKAVVFYYFTVLFVRSERDLKLLVFVFLACQTFRVLEPLYLHVTQGYWGSVASMSNWEFMNRLSGSPYDVVNPNGLAAIVCTVLLFLYFLARTSRLAMLAFWCVAPACLYALALTGSRSGVLTMAMIFVGILVKSNRRVLVGTTGVLIALVGFHFLSADHQDRYLSTFGFGERNLVTAEQRVDGIEADFQVALRKPIVGHGLGTSKEANSHFGTNYVLAHNLYVEILQELGFAGLAIFLLFLKSIFSASLQAKRAYPGAASERFLPCLVDALQVWLWVNLFSSFASYGLSTYEWYLQAGLLIAVRRLATAANASPAPPSQPTGPQT
jgi:O-antigen ligase